MRYLVFSRFLGVFIAQTCLCRTAHGAFTFYTGELTVGRRRTISARQIVLQEQRLHDLDVDCCRNKITCLNAENSMDVEAAEDKSDKIDEREKELTPEEIAELVEVAFVNSVMQLASGLVDVLKLFIVAVKASYERGMNVVKVDGRSSSDGISLLEALDACPVQSANRPLMQEESELRLTWISLIYLTLERLNRPVLFCDGRMLDDGEAAITFPFVEDKYRQKYADFINNIVQANVSGKSLSQLDVKSMAQLSDNGSTRVNPIGNLDTPMEKAILLHSMRLIYLTMTVVDEENECSDEGGVGPAPPPRPYIPGT